MAGEGLKLPRIGLGTWSVFDTDGDMTWLADEALAAGVTLFDSSPMYGRAEAALAQALGQRRSRVQVATKVSAVDAEEGEAQIANACALFGTVDLFQIHNIVSWRLHLPWLAELKARGVVGKIGASQGLLVTDGEFAEVMRTGELDTIQIRYNPRRREAAERILPLAEELGIRVLVMQPLRWGAIRASPTPDELRILEVPGWAAAVLRWILTDPRVSTVLTATSRPGRIAANALAGKLPAFDADQLEMFERILARGPASLAPQVSVGSSVSSSEIQGFLAARLGAGFCIPCLSRYHACPSGLIARYVDDFSAEYFALETAPCLDCGDIATIVRSRTIMR